jgi:hypothetical protein
MANDITKSPPPFSPSLAAQAGQALGVGAKNALGGVNAANTLLSLPSHVAWDQLKQGWGGAVAGFNGTPLAPPAPAATPAAAPAPVAAITATPPALTAAIPAASPEIHADNVQSGSLYSAYQQGKTAGNPAQAAAPSGTFTPQQTSFGNNTPATSGDYKGMTQNEINSGWAHKNMVLDAQLALQNPNVGGKERQMYLGMLAGEMQGYNHSQDANTQANAQKYGADRGVDVANIHSGDRRYATDASVENTNTTNSAHIYGVDSAANTAERQRQLNAANTAGQRQAAAIDDIEYRNIKTPDDLRRYHMMRGGGRPPVVVQPGASVLDPDTLQLTYPQLSQPR